MWWIEIECANYTEVVLCTSNHSCYSNLWVTHTHTHTIDDFIQLNEPLSKPQPQNGMFYNSESPLSNTPVGFTEDSTQLPPEDTFDGHNYASTYQANGENHFYHELVQTPEPPPLPHRSSVASLKGTGSLRGRPSTRFSVQSITQFPYTMPNTPAPSYPYLEAVPTVQTPVRPLTPPESPVSH